MQHLVSEGGCLCGSVRYRITGTPRSSSVCFCRSCRLASGSPSVAWFVVGIGQYALLSGQLATFRSSSPVTRSFCARCGTPLAYQHTDDPNAIELTTASLDDPGLYPPTREIWHSQKLSWAASDPTLPHFSQESQSEGNTGPSARLHERRDMSTKRNAPQTIDEYISAFSPDVQAILQQVRQVVRIAAPDAQETISYQIPAFKLNGVLVYFAAFKKHIGFYPPVSGDAPLEKAVSPYAGEKGNLRFPLDQPIPFDLIERITKLRVKQDIAKANAKGKESE